VGPIVTESLRAVVAPTGVALALLIALWRPWRRNAAPPDGLLVAALLAAACAANAVITHGWKGVWPTDFTGRVLYFALPGLVAAAVVRFVPIARRPWVRSVLAVAAAFVIVWALSHSRRAYGWEGWRTPVWTVALTALGAAIITGLEAGMAGRRAGGSLVLAVTAAVFALVLFDAHIASLSENTGPISMFCGTMGVLGLIRRGPVLDSVSWVVGAVLFGLFVSGYLYSSKDDNPRAAFTLAAATALVPALGLALRSRPATRLMGELVVLAALAGAAQLTLPTSAPDASPADEYEMDYGTD